MGQRSQIIIKLPKYYINNKNPNNRDEEYLIFHNQWLYGWGFIKHLRDIVQNFNLITEDYKKGSLSNFTPDYREFIEKAVLCANYKDPTNIRKTRIYSLEDNTTNDNQYISTFENWNDLFKSLDNNNGFIFLNITKEGEIEYDILNGLEDDTKILRRTPIQYLGLFYPKEEIVEFSKRLIEDLNKFSRFDHNSLKTI